MTESFHSWICFGWQTNTEHAPYVNFPFPKRNFLKIWIGYYTQGEHLLINARLIPQYFIRNGVWIVGWFSYLHLGLLVIRLLNSCSSHSYGQLYSANREEAMLYVIDLSLVRHNFPYPKRSLNLSSLLLLQLSIHHTLLWSVNLW